MGKWTIPATMLVAILLTVLGASEALAQAPAMATVALRGGSWGSSGEATEFGLPQVLVVLGAFVLLVLLAGLVIWRIRRGSRTGSK